MHGRSALRASRLLAAAGAGALALAAAAPPAGADAPGDVATPLPLVRIDMRGPLQDEPKSPARLRVGDRPGGALNRPGDPANAYDGWAGVELRGQTSLAWPKKSMAVETRCSS